MSTSLGESTDRASAHTRWDVVVIGAGPSGSVAAHALARAGRSVVLLDRSSMPRTKVCGCCLSTGGVRALADNGLDRSLAGAVPATHCTIRAGGSSARIAVDGYRVIGRDVLDHRLSASAAEAGAKVLLGHNARVDAAGGVEVRAAGHHAMLRLTPRAVIIADGLAGTSLSDRGEFAWRVRRQCPMGVGAVVTRPPVPLARGEISMLCGREGYLGFVRLATGEINVAAAFDPAAVRAMPGPDLLARRIIARCGGDPGALDGAVWRGTPLLTRERSCVASGNVFVVGDAARYVEPFTGEGMAWAIRSATSAAGVVGDWLDGRVAAGAWAVVHRRSLGAQYRRCAILSRMMRHEWVMRSAVTCAGRWPSVGCLAARALGPPELTALARSRV